MQRLLRRYSGQEHREDTGIYKASLEEDKMGEQLSIPCPGSPFTGRK